MYKQLDTLFAEHAAPSRCSTRNAHTQIAPITDLVADLQEQISLYRRLVVAAELAPHDNAIDSKLNYLHNQLDGLHAVASEIVGKWRSFSQGMVAFDRIMCEAKTDLANYAERHAPAEVAGLAD